MVGQPRRTFSHEYTPSDRPSCTRCTRVQLLLPLSSLIHLSRFSVRRRGEIRVHVRAPNHRIFSCRRLLTVPAASPENNSSLAEAVSGL